jgi:peptide/nickel transport system ATP-binding protein
MTVRNFNIQVKSGNRMIVASDNFSVQENEITFLFGESGIGKSVLSKAVYGLFESDDLDITINGQCYSHHINDKWTQEVRKNSFFVFQEPSSHLNPLMTILDQLNEGSLSGINDKDLLNYFWQNSESTSISNILNIFPKPYRPSGGEKQRILLVMAFKRINAYIESQGDKPNFFVFDEPTGSLDNKYRDLFLKILLYQYSIKPFSAQIITHDYSIISELYKNYKPLLHKIHFKELSRINDTEVRTNNFSAEDYISWIKNSKWTSAKKTVFTDPVLEVSPEFSIFRKKHCIYRDSAKTVTDSLLIDHGDIVYLKAPSGIGKTTLAKIIAGIYKPDKFSMRLCGVTYNEKTPEEIWAKEIWGKRAGMVFQHADESLDLESTVKETFDGLPLKKTLSINEIKNRLSELFDGPISDNFLSKKVKFLSGGQKQRLNLLRTLILDTKLLILDEPLNGLDFNSVKRVLTLLDLQKNKGTSILMISHNEEIFETFIKKDNIYYLS